MPRPANPIDDFVFAGQPIRNGIYMSTKTTRPNANRRVSRDDALKRLATKQVSPAYRPPRGNADIDREQLNVSVGASERLLTH